MTTASLSDRDHPGLTTAAAYRSPGSGGQRRRQPGSCGRRRAAILLFAALRTSGGTGGQWERPKWTPCPASRSPKISFPKSSESQTGGVNGRVATRSHGAWCSPTGCRSHLCSHNSEDNKPTSKVFISKESQIERRRQDKIADKIRNRMKSL